MTTPSPRILLGPCLALLLAGGASAAERINQEGRILGPAPTVSAPTLFDTAGADSIVSAMQIMPVTSAWNEDVSALPLFNTPSASSAAIIGNIRNDLAANPTRQRMVVFQEMNYVLVPDSEPLVDIDFLDYPDESDDLKPVGPGNNPQHIGSWPIPSNLPIEGWPTQVNGETLAQVQTDALAEGGDRHAIMVMPGQGFIWETWQTQLTTGNPAWTASNGAKFPLTTNVARPAGWTSGDAAGLPMFPALVRYDEAERGMVEHAMRIVVKRSQKAYLYPATHQAGSTTDPTVPAMGQRLRLKAGFIIPATWTKEEKAIALALKKYGALVADNGNFFSISICPDERWPAHAFDHFSTNASTDFCDINNFEVVQSTTATGGPRSAGAPTANAGADQTVALAAGAALTGTASGAAITSQWYLYPAGTTGATIANPANPTTTVQFATTGTYTLMLKVTDGVHAPAFDATVITVQADSNPAPTLTTVVPNTVVQNAATTVTLNGTGFVSTSTVTIGAHAPLAVATVTATQLTVAVPASYLANVGTFQITVANPAPGGGTSGAQILTITADTTPPLINPPSIQAGTSSATISWTTNEAASATIDYGTSATYGLNHFDATFTTAHTEILSGLAAGTVYHYRITAADAAGNLATTPDATFQTAAFDQVAGAGGSSSDSCGSGSGFGLVIALLGLLGARRRRTVGRIQPPPVV
jgi:hypothetical protein